jgi:hypothetical protein
VNEIQIREFDALRETIRSRGTARPIAFLLGISVWGALLVAVLAWLPNPLAATLPLTVLVGTFEVVRTLHLGVERIGRYLQTFFEAHEIGTPLIPPAWETTAMAFGPTLPGAGGHPLFLPIVVIATLLNYLAVIFPGPVVVELWTLAIPHIAFVVWMVYCDRAMRKQRASELARFRELKAGSR